MCLHESRSHLIVNVWYFGDKREEGDEGEEVIEEGGEPADDGGGDVVQKSDLDGFSSPSVSLPLAETTPSRSSRLKITLKLPTQTQKPPRVPHAIHKDKDMDSDIESEDNDEDDHPRGGDGKRPLMTHQAVLASVVGSSHFSLVQNIVHRQHTLATEGEVEEEESASAAAVAGS
ncbi:hypothetical protein BC827DRAFT_1386900 [Russula dissimulans]|nr:hypothetical protein BC827DRAFT_1386900 [Russula dissimulans]